MLSLKRIKKININKILEIAVFNLHSLGCAAKAGALRAELCSNYLSGGITPGYNIIKKARDVNISLNVMIRSRPGNFVYSKSEIEEMVNNVISIKKLKVDGFVFGALLSDNNIDIESCKKIIDAASPLHVTFHRAIDLCPDLSKAVDVLIQGGFTRILTSGGKANATEGAYIIHNLINDFGEKIIIMPGGGIRKENIKEISEITGAKEFHSAAITEPNSETASTEEIKSLKLALDFRL